MTSRATLVRKRWVSTAYERARLAGDVWKFGSKYYATPKRVYAHRAAGVDGADRIHHVDPCRSLHGRVKDFPRLKAVGDLNARLRTAASTLRDDLSADHFEVKRRLSDPTFWAQGPPQEGYFRLWHSSSLAAAGAGSFYSEGNPDGIDSFYATDQSLEFTVKKRGNNRQDFYSATVPANSPLLTLGTPDSRYQDTANVYNSQWAEVAWFLRANGATSGTLPLFTLYRRQRVVVPSTIVPGAGGATTDLNYQSPGVRSP